MNLNRSALLLLSYQGYVISNFIQAHNDDLSVLTSFRQGCLSFLKHIIFIFKLNKISNAYKQALNKVKQQENFEHLCNIAVWPKSDPPVSILQCRVQSSHSHILMIIAVLMLFYKVQNVYLGSSGRSRLNVRKELGRTQLAT